MTVLVMHRPAPPILPLGSELPAGYRIPRLLLRWAQPVRGQGSGEALSGLAQLDGLVGLIMGFMSAVYLANRPKLSSSPASLPIMKGMFWPLSAPPLFLRPSKRP